MNFTSPEITQIIVAIIGLLGLIFQGIITYIVSKRRDNFQGLNETIVKIRKTANYYPSKYKWISIIIAFVFLILAIPGTRILYNKNFSEPFIVAYSPKQNDVVEATIDINGKYRNIDQNEQLIWIAVYSNSDSKYFLHICPANIIPLDKTWNNDGTMIGMNGDKNKKFHILILLVKKNSKCHSEILKYVNDESRHGLDKLPGEYYILKDITVFIR